MLQNPPPSIFTVCGTAGGMASDPRISFAPERGTGRSASFQPASDVLRGKPGRQFWGALGPWTRGGDGPSLRYRWQRAVPTPVLGQRAGPRDRLTAKPVSFHGCVRPVFQLDRAAHGVACRLTRQNTTPGSTACGQGEPRERAAARPAGTGPEAAAAGPLASSTPAATSAATWGHISRA